MYPSADHQTYNGLRQHADPRPLQGNQPHRHVDTRLTDVIKHGRAQDMLQLINEALAAGANLQHCHATQKSRLETAVLANNLAAVQTLLAKGAQPPDVDANGKDLLMLAAEHSSADIVTHILKTREIDPRYTDHFGQTALMYAVRHGDLQSVTALLQWDADINAATFHEAHHHADTIFGGETDFSGGDVTPLMIAVALGDKPMVQRLLEFGADIHCGTHDFPLSIAAQSADLSVLHCLLAKNPDTSGHNKDGLTPLHIAIKAGASAACVAALLAQTDIEVRTDTRAQLTPLGLAISLQNVEIAALLIQKNALLRGLSTAGVTAWELLPSRADVKSEMADLLVFSGGSSVFHSSADVAVLLDELIRLGSCMGHPGRFGLFTKLLTAIEPLLTAVISDPNAVPGHQPPNTMLLHRRLAHAIASDKALNALAAVAPVHPAQDDLPATTPALRIAEATTAQAKQLTSAAQQRLSTVCLNGLRYLAETLRNNLTDPDNASDFTIAELARHLQQDSGLPAALATQIAQCWRDAVTLSLAMFDTQGHREAQQRYVQKLLSLLLTSGLPARQYALPDSFEARLAETLAEGAADAAAALSAFFADPPKVIRAIEQRHSLRDANRDTLSTALCLQTGLPPACVVTVVEAWAASVATVKKMQGVSSSAQVHAALSAQFAKALNQRLHTIPEAESEHLQALHAKVITGLSTWCSTHLPHDSDTWQSAESYRSSSSSSSGGGGGGGGGSKRPRS